MRTHLEFAPPEMFHVIKHRAIDHRHPTTADSLQQCRAATMAELKSAISRKLEML